MARCPFAVWRPVPNFGGPMETYLGVVIHVTAGEGDPYNWFSDPVSQVSSHFGIGNGQGGMADGLLEQFVDTANQSWAQASGNGSYLSVETEGEPTDPLTSEQIWTFARVMVWAHQMYGIPLQLAETPGQTGLIWHGAGGSAWGGHLDCPGPQRVAQRAQILNAAKAMITPPPPPIQEAGNMVFYDEISGGSWVTNAQGEIFAFDGAPDLGAFNFHAGDWTPNGPCVGGAFWKGSGQNQGGNGYVLYAWPASASKPNPYHFDRAGSQRPK